VGDGRTLFKPSMLDDPWGGADPGGRQQIYGPGVAHTPTHAPTHTHTHAVPPRPSGARFASLSVAPPLPPGPPPLPPPGPLPASALRAMAGGAGAGGSQGAEEAQPAAMQEIDIDDII
jgi:hypothetical protein